MSYKNHNPSHSDHYHGSDSRINNVDVICEHKSDGTIIPMHFQIIDEDGTYQRFTIKGYLENKIDGTYTTKDYVYVTKEAKIFECKINVLGYKKFVRLYFFSHNM